MDHMTYIKSTLHKYLLIFITMSCTRLVNADSSKMKIILPKIAKKNYLVNAFFTVPPLFPKTNLAPIVTSDVVY